MRKFSNIASAKKDHNIDSVALIPTLYHVAKKIADVARPICGNKSHDKIRKSKLQIRADLETILIRKLGKRD